MERSSVVKKSNNYAVIVSLDFCAILGTKSGASTEAEVVCRV